MSVRPWRLAHRGTVPAAGVLFARGDDPAEAARRALRCWEPGCDVVCVGDDWAVLWQRPRAVHAAGVEGAPLVAQRRKDGAAVRATAPLGPTELDALLAGGAREEDIVRVVAGVAATYPLAGAARVDPAAWIDPGAVDLAAEVVSLGDPPPPVVVAGAAAPRWYDEGIGPALAATLTEAARAASGESPAPQLPWWMRALAWLRARLVAQAVVTRVLPPGAPPAAEAPRPVALAQPSWWDRLQARFAGSLFGARLEQHLGARQAKYLQDMVAMFEEGRLHEALKRAIPLGGNDPDVAEKPMSWSVPKPRAGLEITLAQSTTRTAASPPDLHDTLNGLYRRAVESLDAEGRAEEAAFVLAELLRDPGAAVALLERHARFDAAARLADRARMDPALRVRQWLRAGDTARAFALARRHRCYEAAATMLDAVDGDLAAALRAAHARHLAAAGDLAAAVRAGQRLPALRAEVLGWMDALIARGGVEGARVLPARVLAEDGSFEVVRSRVLALCAADDARAERAALADALLAESAPSEALETLTRPLVRALVRDAAVSGDEGEARRVAKLAQRGADRALAADLPQWPTFLRAMLASAVGGAHAAHPNAQVIDGADRGLRAVTDAAALPDGRVLLAFGESGAELWSRAGRCVHRFDEPCAALVVSDHGDRALALAPRGESWRVAVLELDARRSRPWADLRLDAFAGTFDGDGWVVAQDGRVLELDAQDPAAGALRALVDAPTEITVRSRALALDRCPRAVMALARHEDLARRDAHTAAHVWDAVTARELSTRALDTLDAVGSPPRFGAVDARTEVVVRIDREADGRDVLLIITRSGRTSWPVEGEAVGLSRHNGWTCVLTRDPEGLTATLYNPNLHRCLSVRLVRASRGAVRLDAGTLTVADDLGRVRVIDLARGAVLRDLRV